MPGTYREGDRVVLPITFPDGTSAELVYSAKLEIAELGVFPYTSARSAARARRSVAATPSLATS